MIHIKLINAVHNLVKVDLRGKFILDNNIIRLINAIHNLIEEL